MASPSASTQSTRETVVAIGAHPDDIDFRSGGTLARYVSAGARVHYVVVTDGDRGSWEDRSPLDLGAVRRGEQEAAARVIGAERVVFLHRQDGAVFDVPGLRQELCLWLRILRPNVLITHDPWRRYNLHPDHRAVGQAACDAVITARNANFLPEQLEHLEPWAIGSLLLFMPLVPDHIVDISEHVDRKADAVLKHRSQLEGWRQRAPVSDEPIEAAIRRRVLDDAAAVAAGAAFAFGERFHRIGFRRRADAA